MKKPLKVLIVEDSADDAELILRELRRQGYEPAHQCVRDAASMRAALARQGWDVILSDHALPHFGIKLALEICKEQGLDVPLICVSGKISEAEAVEMMQQGAHDYLMKDDLGRLGMKIEHELLAAKYRAELAQERLMKAHLAAIVENSNDAIISTNLGGTILSWNHAAEAIYGYRAEEVIGRPISIIMPPGFDEQLAGFMERLRTGEVIKRYETACVRKDGSMVEISLTVSPTKGSIGQITGVSVIARDITERRQKEQELLALNEEFKEALAHVKTLKGLLPICAACKKIRDDHGYWLQVEAYVQEHSDAKFTHSLCPDCVKRLYPDMGLDAAD